MFLDFLRYGRKLLFLGESLQEGDYEKKGSKNFQKRCECFHSVLLEKKNNVVKTFFSYFCHRMLLLCIPRVIAIVFELFRPYLLYIVLNSFDTFSINKSEMIENVLFFGILLYVIENLHMICNEMFYFGQHKLSNEVKYILDYILYKKSLKVMDLSNKNDIVNLISTDTDRIKAPIRGIYDFPGHIIRITISFIYLYYLLSISSLITLVILIFILVPINFYCLKYSSSLDKEIRLFSDKRVDLMKDIISNIKMIKSNFWERLYYNKIQFIRNKEIHCIKKTSISWSIVELLWCTSTFILTSLSFICFVVILKEELTIPVVFSVITIVSQITWPIFSFAFQINNVMKCKTSIKRVENFLNLSERPQIHCKRVDNDEKDDLYAVRIENGSFAWNKKDIILKDISLKIKRGELTMIIGEVGSGKTSLISSILGEMNQLSGEMMVLNNNYNNNFCYVPQLHFIKSTTIRDNIVFGHEFCMNNSIKRYNKILNYCQLLKDLSKFPLYDLTNIGTNGVTLSGGQKARISIARALYNHSNNSNRNDIFIFDDPFKDLDVTVCNKVYENVFQNMLGNKTRILVTHQKRFLKYADSIIVMKNGKIFLSGSFNDLKDHPYMRNISFVDVNTRGEGGEESDERDMLKNNVVYDENMINDNGMMIQKKKKVKYTKFNWSLAWKYVSIYPKTFLLGVVLTIVKVIFENYSNYFISLWSLDVNYSSHSLSYYIIVYLLLGISTSFIIITAQIIINFVVLYTAKYFHSKLLHSILNTTIKWFNNTKSGEIISRFSEDQDVLQNEMRWRVREFVFTAIYIIGNFCFIFYLVPFMVLICVPIIIFSFYIGKKFTVFFARHSRISRGVGNRIITHLNESLDGLPVIRSFNKEFSFINQFYSLIEKNFMFENSFNDADMFMCIVLRLSSILLIILFIILSVLSINVYDNATFSMVFSKIIGTIYDVSWLVYIIAGLQKNIACVERIVDFSLLKSECDTASGVKKYFKDKLKGKIEYKNVSFSYNYKCKEEELVLKNISFTINEGEKVAVIGRSGSGKSTIIKLLFRLYQIKKGNGQILIDNIDISSEDMSLEELRTSLVYISQNVSIFDGTIRQNIDVESKYEYNDKEIWDVLEKVNLKNRIKKLKLQLDTNVKDIKFSCGEQQLIAFSRALLNKKKILVLDEPTSSIDDESDKMCSNIIENQFKNCTKLIVQHRLDTICDSDKIIVLHDGKIMQIGTPKQLLLQKNSMFFNMIMQTGKEKSEYLKKLILNGGKLSS